MKKIVIAAFLTNCIIAVSLAQTPARAAVKPPPKSELTVENKNGLTSKQEANMQEALSAAGLSDDQMKAATEIVAGYGKRNKEVKDNEKLTFEEKARFMKSNNDERNAKLKELMGEEKFNLFTDARKKQQGATKKNQLPE